MKTAIFSQSILLSLVRKGAQREDAYKFVQRNAMRSWNEGKDFMALLKKDRDINKHLSSKDLEKVFEVKSQFKNVERIFKRVFKTK